MGSEYRRIIRTVVLTATFILGLAMHAAVGNSASAPVVTTLSSITDGVSTPVRIAIDPSGDIYVTDPRGGGILRYNNAGRLQQTITTETYPLGVAIAQSGDLLVSQGSYVAVIDKTSGVVRSRFGTFAKANGITVAGNGAVYVVDSPNNCVQLFDAAYTPISTGLAATGRPANSFGDSGRSDGQFLQPTGVTVGHDINASGNRIEYVAVVDTLNGRVQFFSPMGVYQKTIGSFGAGPLKFTSPQAITFEYTTDDKSLARMYVVDTYQGNVQAIDAAGTTFLRYIGGYGITGGKLAVPGDVVFDRFDSNNHRLIVANGTGVLALFGIDSGGTTTPGGPALTINSIPLATTTAALTISGTTSNGATVTINGLPATVTGTAWSGDITLNSGFNVITVVATYGSGSSTSSVDVNLLASTGTAVALTMNPLPAYTANSVLTIAGTVTNGASVKLNGVAATVTGTAWSLPVALVQGVNNFQVVASLAGMSDSIISVNVTFDNNPPVLTTHLPQNGSTTSAPVLTISGTVSGTSAITVTIDINGIKQSQPANDGMFSIPIVLGNGSNSITVTVTDLVGNTSVFGPRVLIYDSQAPMVTVATPSGAATGVSLYTLSGVAPAGSTVTVNGVPVTMSSVSTTMKSVADTVTGVAWTATVALTPGVNYFDIKATDTVSGKSSTIIDSVSYAPGMPSIAITTPPQDVVTTATSYTIAGSATPGVSIAATVNGTSVPVSVNASGDFSLVMPSFTAPGSYAATISASDNSGNIATAVRTIIYDSSNPTITLLSSVPPKVTGSGGVLKASDKNGSVGTVIVSGSVSTLDLTGVAYDPASLNIQVINAAGISTRDGDLNLDGKVDIADALLALQMSVGLAPAPTFGQLLHGDVGPLVNHLPVPDGKVRLDDAIVILNKAIGLGW
jgi:hypothetical protein